MIVHATPAYYIVVFFFLLSLRLRRLKSLTCKLIGLVLGTVGLERLVRLVRNTFMCGKVFAHYEPRWSPIRELAAAVVVYFEPRIAY